MHTMNVPVQVFISMDPVLHALLENLVTLMQHNAQDKWT